MKFPTYLSHPYQGAYAISYFDKDGNWKHFEERTRSSSVLPIHLWSSKKAANKRASELRKDKIMEMSVSELEISIRASNCLHDAQIQTVGQIISWIKSGRLRYCRNFGKKSLKEIQDALFDLGIDIRKQ